MKGYLIPIDSYLEVASVFDWGTMVHYQLWFTGQMAKRHRRTETVLKRLTRRGKLKSFLYGRKLIYTLTKKKQKEEWGLSNVYHGLACTECLVRFYRSRLDGMAIAEKYFRGLGCVPEWGILYPEGKMILLEFCTKNNFYFSGNMRGKLQAYKKHLKNIEEKFNAKAIVIFVIDIPRETVERFVLGNGMSACGTWAGSVGGVPPLSDGDTFPYPFFFTDYKTFLSVPIGQQLIAPIYFWSDGKTYPLSENVGL